MSGDELILLCRLEESWDHCSKVVSAPSHARSLNPLLCECEPQSPRRHAHSSVSTRRLSRGHQSTRWRYERLHHVTPSPPPPVSDSVQCLPLLSDDWRTVMSPADWLCACGLSYFFSSPLIDFIRVKGTRQRRVEKKLWDMKRLKIQKLQKLSSNEGGGRL